MIKRVLGTAFPSKTLVSQLWGMPKIYKLFMPGYSARFFNYSLFVQKKYQIILQSLFMYKFQVKPFYL